MTWSVKSLLIAELHFFYAKDAILSSGEILGIKEKLKMYGSVLHLQFLIQNCFALLCEREIKSAFMSED